MLTELTVKKIIPGLEHKVRDLNQQVSIPGAPRALATTGSPGSPGARGSPGSAGALGSQERSELQSEGQSCLAVSFPARRLRR